MSADVLTFSSPARVDAAWHEYIELRTQSFAKPELLTDRPFMERLAKAEDRWRRLERASESQ